MVKKPEVSVVISLYGKFDLARIYVSVQSILFQQEIKHEIIVSEQGEFRRFPEIKGVKHVFKYHKPRPELSDFNPGNVRNRAIEIATGEFIYTNDADIVFQDSQYLAKSLEMIRNDPNMIFYRPLMRRLPIDEFAGFEKEVQDKGIIHAVNSLDISQKYIATLSGKPKTIRVFEKDGVYQKTFTAFEEDFQFYIGDDKNKGSEPVFWNENRHCGGNLFRIEHFKNVGGYCEEFINWGCEDSDLQWKFHETYNLKFFPDTLEVLHLDHPKEYFSPEMWIRNENICSQRKINGLERAIEADKRNKSW